LDAAVIGRTTRHARVIASSLLTLLVLASCAGATQPFAITRAAHIKTNVAAEETEAVLQAAEEGLRQQLSAGSRAKRGGLRRAYLQSVAVDGPMGAVHGCGTFYYADLPERNAIRLVLVKDGGKWRLHSWEVETEAIDGPVTPCH
jgi:hypothetical protein